MPIFEAKGDAIQLGNELGRGGEGAVYDIQGRPDFVAKIYHSPPQRDHACKLAAMAAMAEDRLTRVAAWPSGTLHGASGSVVGFLMPKVYGHRPMFQLYGPKLRLQEFPRADWRFLIHAAANAARAFSTLHAAGLVTGDVNHGNLVVAQNGIVRLIDCDSFQVTKDGQTWYCPVGVGTHQPPEMQAVTSYAGIRRTPNHDNFGLAIIIFQLLCMARHPFAGRHLGSGEPPSIEEAIACSRYAYSRERARTQMAPPPSSLAVDTLTPRIQDLFEQAFSPGSSKGTRPYPDQWVTALQELGGDLQPCSVNRGHQYRNGLARCPWCEIEAASGAPLFPAVFVTIGGRQDGMVALWPQITAVAEPRPLPPLLNPTAANATPSVAASQTGSKARRLRLAAYGSTAVAAVTALALVPSGLGVLLAGGAGLLAYIAGNSQSAGVPGEFRRPLQDAEREWDALRQAWMQPMPGTPPAQERAKLNELKTRHDALAIERAGRLQRLSERLRQRQLENHLDRFAIASARISGIGQAKVVTLSAYGIDTAADVTDSRIRVIPGFGPATTAKLLAWRRQHEQAFRFDSTVGVPQTDIAAVERDIALERNRLETEVAAGLARLKAIAAAADMRRRMLEDKVAELQPRLAQAMADAKAAGASAAASGRMLGVSGAVLVMALFVGLDGNGPSRQIASFPSVAPVLQSAPHAVLQPEPPPPVGPTPRPSTPLSPLALPVQEQLPERRLVAPTVPPQIVPHGVALIPPPSPIPSWSQAASAPAAGSADSAERMVTRQAANVREAPNVGAAVVRTVPSGAVLHVFGRSSGWVQVGESSPWGWVYSGLLNRAP